MKENRLPVEIGGVLYDVPVRVSLHITALEMDLAKANADRAELKAKIEELAERLAEIEKQEPISDSNSFIQRVPDHCDRIVWRGRYLHLPVAGVTAPKRLTDEEIEALAEDQAMQPWGIGSRRRDCLTFARAIEAALLNGEAR